MSGKVFLDSNILIYAATGRHDYPSKFQRAEEIVSHAEFGISTQVVGEFVHNVQNARKMRRPLTDAEVDHWVRRMYEFPIVDIDSDIIQHAIIVKRRYQLRYWDSQIIASAARYGAGILYSEDLSHDQVYGTVRAVNPFHG